MTTPAPGRRACRACTGSHTAPARLHDTVTLRAERSSPRTHGTTRRTCQEAHTAREKEAAPNVERGARGFVAFDDVGRSPLVGRRDRGGLKARRRRLWLLLLLLPPARETHGSFRRARQPARGPRARARAMLSFADYFGSVWLEPDPLTCLRCLALGDVCLTRRAESSPQRRQTCPLNVNLTVPRQSFI